MKTLKCDLCDFLIPGEDFDNWFQNSLAHWKTEHADEMVEMQTTGTKEEGEKWMADHKQMFEEAYL